MNVLAALLLLVSFSLVTAGVALLSPEAGLITAGVLVGLAGVMLLKVGPRRNVKEPR